MRVTQERLTSYARAYASKFQRNTLEHMLANGWHVQMVQQSPTRKSTAITLAGPSFGIVQPNGMFAPAPKGGKVTGNWKRFDELAEATIPNYNGMPVKEVA